MDAFYKRARDLLDDGLAIIQHAQVERDGAGVDAGYPGHIIGP